MQTRKIIIDCDPGIDDTLALNLAIQSPAVEVVAITIVCGNVPVQIGVDMPLSVLNASGGSTFPFMLVRINRSINHLSVRRIRMAWMV